MKKVIHISFIVLILTIICACFSACDLFGFTEKDLTGNYELVSFTTADSTFNVGDNYNGESLSSSSIKLELQEYDSGFVDNDGKNVKVRRFVLTFNIEGGRGSLGFFEKNGNSLNLPSLTDSEYNCTAKVDGSKITVTFPSDSVIKSATLKKS